MGCLVMVAVRSGLQIVGFPVSPPFVCRLAILNGIVQELPLWMMLCGTGSSLLLCGHPSTYICADDAFRTRNL